MIRRIQYIRLTIVLLIPLLILGWWLAYDEVLFKNNYLVSCQEFNSYITCNSSAIKKNDDMDLLYRNGTIKLHGAKLIHGFEHPVILTELEETKKINGNDFELLPTNPRHVTMLKLPPNFMNRSNLLSCEISEIESKQNNWTYLCSGDRNIIGFFKFLENDTNKKFKDSILLIEQQRTENKNRAILTMSISTLLPVLFYALLSTILFCLIKIFRYVIYGFDKKEPKA